MRRRLPLLHKQICTRISLSIYTYTMLVSTVVYMHTYLHVYRLSNEEFPIYMYLDSVIIHAYIYIYIYIYICTCSPAAPRS